MALGAPAAGIFGLVIRQGLRLILVGIVIGVPSALFATEVLSALLFGVSGTDPVTFVGMPLLLAAVAIVACYVPARRATRVDPIAVLRCN
jgi:ABC-type antimicrobial peptide transport system permease subunit